MIVKLDKETIGKIAAGEVIERPLNIVKELVENSIDAESTRISIEVFNAGIDKIIVKDNGVGFLKDDLKLAFVSHATSKIKDINDIYSIKSFGFRGEALYSIGIISKATIISKREDESVAKKIINNCGLVSEIQNCQGNNGTVIIVEDLFKNVPVRKKFLKSEKVETKLIHNMIEKIALSHKNVSIKYVEDGIEKFSSSGDNNLKNIVYTIYGKEIYDNLLDIDYNYNGIKASGVILRPQITRNNRNDEIFFVNKRYVKSDIFFKAVEDAYREFLMQHKFPFAILNLDIDYDVVDVYVHPQKLEVKFTDTQMIYNTIFDAINKKLKTTNLIVNDTIIDEDVILDIDNKKKEEKIDELKTLDYYIEDVKKEKSDVSNYEKNTVFDKINDKNLNAPKDFFYDLINNFNYVGQIFDTYIIFEYDDKVYFIDQHAAHEKINYEKYINELNMNTVVSQKIMPYIISLTSFQKETVEENIEYFKKAGFEIELFGDNDIIIQAVPYCIIEIGRKELLLDMIDNFSKEKNIYEYESINDKIATISCKSAVKGNHKLLDIEAKKLIEDLFKLNNPYTCPHGRPTVIEFTKYEFDKKFKRIIN